MQSLKTIAFISVYSDPANEIGSRNVYVRRVGEALSRLGWQVDMFTRKSAPDRANIVQHNPRCRTIRLTAGVKDFIPRQNLIGHLPEFLKQLRQFQLDNDLQYRLIHTNYWLSAWVGMELKKVQSLKHIHTYHSLGAVEYSYEQDLSNIAQTRLAIEKACLETADLTVATCPQQKRYLRELVSDRGNVEIISCGTDPELFGSVTYSQARTELQIESDTFNVLYVGKLNRISGIKTLIKAISKPQLRSMPDLRLTLIDNSPSSDPLPRKRIEKLTQDLAVDNITTFVGGLNREELAVYYAAADVCVVPSQYDPAGMVAIEAMASGTAVIASNLGGLKYVVQPEKTGLLFPAQNSFSLTKAIYRLATKSQLRSQLAKYARTRIEELFTWDSIASQLSEFYSEQIGQLNLKLLDKSLRYAIRAIGA